MKSEHKEWHKVEKRLEERSGRMIYMDNAATTRTAPEVLEAMRPYFTELYGNPSSIYAFSDRAKEGIEASRRILADMLGAKPEEIYFTGGGTEADNWALTGAAEACAGRGRHIITTKIEHHAVLHTAQYLERRGFEVTYVNVDENGVVKLGELERAIRPDTILISVMFANNEIGTVQPIREIGELARRHGILFHTDAVQAFGHLPIRVDRYHIDMLSASAHKFCGPKGVGFLYMRGGTGVGPLLHGGAQERGQRAGTENVPGIVGMGKAAQRAAATMRWRAERERRLRDRLIQKIMREVPYVRLNGHRDMRLPNNASFCFQFVEGEALLVMLDMKGICASSGSACTSGQADASHVLLACGLPEDIAHGSLRLTLSEENTAEEMDYVAEAVRESVESLRNMSPAYEDFRVQPGGNMVRL